MSKKVKIILISVISVIVAAAIGVGIYFIVRKPDVPDQKYEIDGSDEEHTKLY